jgi:hypothetical protein
LAIGPIGFGLNSDFFRIPARLIFAGNMVRLMVRGEGGFMMSAGAEIQESNVQLMMGAKRKELQCDES